MSLQTAPDRILVVCTRRIGDVLLTTPLIHSLKAAYPQAQIDALVFKGTEGILQGNPDLAGTLTIPQRPMRSESWGLLRRIFRQYDLALSALPSDKANLYAWLAGRKSYGLLEDLPKSWWKKILLTGWTAFDNDHTHTVRMNLALTKLLDIPALGTVIPPRASADALRAKLPFDPGSTTYAVFHLYPMYEYKAWRKDSWPTLAQEVHRQHGLRIVLTGGPGEHERQYARDVAAQMPADTLDLSGALKLAEVAELIRGAKLFVGPDTVVTHLAAATGTPTVALFGPSSPVKWGPWPQQQTPDQNPFVLRGTQIVGNVALVQGVAPCVPCLLEGCERHLQSRSDCLVNLQPAAVAAAAAKLLES